MQTCSSLSITQQNGLFRFTLAEIEYLCDLFRIPDPFLTSRRYKLPARKALCVLLFRMSGTRSVIDVSMFFGISPTYVSTIWIELVELLVSLWGNIVRFNKQRMITSREKYALAIRTCGTPLKNCLGFIDGTNREISRPSVAQGVFYSGHKHYHSFKFQAWVTPDGLISNIFGPIPGARHDLLLWSKSKIEEHIFSTPEFEAFCVFGDQGYHNAGHLLSPFPGLLS